MTHPFTPAYLAMAKAAEEIQAMRPKEKSFEDLDFVALGLGVACWDTVETVTPDYEGDLAKAAWLPRLDQLMGMLGTPADVIEMLADQEIGAIHIMPLYHVSFGLSDDWHETVITVVMREKHGKQWRDGAWKRV